MKLIDLFHLEFAEESQTPEESITPADALLKAFGALTCGSQYVKDTVSDCLADTQEFYNSRKEWKEVLEKRGLNYSSEAEPWLCVIAAVESAIQKGYLQELRPHCSPDEFVLSLKKALAAAEIRFSPDRLTFDTQKSLAEWARQFNEYAGQSGITLYFIELYGESRVMGAARIADYAEAAEIAGFAGVKITCRPD